MVTYKTVIALFKFYLQPISVFILTTIISSQ